MYLKTFNGFSEIIAEDENDKRILKKVFVLLKTTENKEHKPNDYSLQDDEEGHLYLLIGNGE